MEKLALNGGKPVAQNGEFSKLNWPPVSEKTADKVRELYLSGAWSFNSAAEQAFEKKYAAYHDAAHGIFMANGTVTLECALEALGVGKGDEVIVPGLTWIATAMAVKYVGAKIVFADIDPETYTLDPESFESRITPLTKAVIPVHIYGSMADLEKIIAIARKHNIAVIEDCAHMQGGKWNGKGVGSWGDVGSFSFQQSKTLSSGEGGICIANDQTIAEKLYRAKHIGYSRYDEQGKAGTPPPPGLTCHNYRGLAISAQILDDQLDGLAELLDQYNAFVSALREKCADIEGLHIQSPGRLATRQGYYSLGLSFYSARWRKFDRMKIFDMLIAENVIVGGTYGPVYKHLLFNLDSDEFRNDGCPVTDDVCDRTLVLMHWFMGNMHNLELLSAALHKISDNLDQVEG